MIVISNTTPLIGVSILGHFDLLKQLFGEVTIPKRFENTYIPFTSKRKSAAGLWGASAKFDAEFI